MQIRTGARLLGMSELCHRQAAAVQRREREKSERNARTQDGRREEAINQL